MRARRLRMLFYNRARTHTRAAFAHGIARHNHRGAHARAIIAGR